MPMEDDNFWKYFGWAMVVTLAIAGWYLHSVRGPELEQERAVRQEQVSTFYRTHNCRPEGYVATRYEPLRTYRCDNGVYLAQDMR
jgi:hypothetical protein